MIAMVSGFGRRIAQMYRMERAYRQFEEMDRRLLRDIGLDRPQMAMMRGAGGKGRRTAI